MGLRASQDRRRSVVLLHRSPSSRRSHRLYTPGWWASKVAENQGKEKTKDQLQLRKEFQEKYGNKIFPKADKLVVLAVGISKQQNHACAYITWEEICNKTKHPLGKELKSYYFWKKEHGK